MSINSGNTGISGLRETAACSSRTALQLTAQLSLL